MVQLSHSCAYVQKKTKEKENADQKNNYTEDLNKIDKVDQIHSHSILHPRNTEYILYFFRIHHCWPIHQT